MNKHIKMRITRVQDPDWAVKLVDNKLVVYLFDKKWATISSEITHTNQKKTKTISSFLLNYHLNRIFKEKLEEVYGSYIDLADLAELTRLGNLLVDICVDHVVQYYRLPDMLVNLEILELDNGYKAVVQIIKNTRSSTKERRANTYAEAIQGIVRYLVDNGISVPPMLQKQLTNLQGVAHG